MADGNNGITVWETIVQRLGTVYSSSLARWVFCPDMYLPGTTLASVFSVWATGLVTTNPPFIIHAEIGYARKLELVDPTQPNDGHRAKFLAPEIRTAKARVGREVGPAQYLGMFTFQWMDKTSVPSTQREANYGLYQQDKQVAGTPMTINASTSYPITFMKYPIRTTTTDDNAEILAAI